MTVSGDGKYAILLVDEMQIYVTNLQKQGKITGKFPLTPISSDLKNKFAVSIIFQNIIFVNQCS